MKKNHNCFLLVLYCWLIGFPASAQEWEQTLLKGRICNQDGSPIPYATLSVVVSEEETLKETVADADGNYQLTVLTDRATVEGTMIAVKVAAEGCATYWQWHDLIYVPRNEDYNFTLFDAVTFKAGQRSTIVLPVTPDPEAGAYYELSRFESSHVNQLVKPTEPSHSRIFFQRVMTPQANRPYLFIPTHDLTIRLRDLDLSQTPELISLHDSVYFASSYYSSDLELPMSYRILLLDSTADCHYPTVEDKIVRVGALHGYLIIKNAHETAVNLSIVLEGDEQAPSGIKPAATATPEKAKSIFDLHGRRLATPPAKGVYIENGRKKIK